MGKKGLLMCPKTLFLGKSPEWHGPFALFVCKFFGHPGSCHQNFKLGKRKFQGLNSSDPANQIEM